MGDVFASTRVLETVVLGRSEFSQNTQLLEHDELKSAGGVFGYRPNARPNTEWVRGALDALAGVLFVTSCEQFS